MSLYGLFRADHDGEEVDFGPEGLAGALAATPLPNPALFAVWPYPEVDAFLDGASLEASRPSPDLEVVVVGLDEQPAAAAARPQPVPPAATSPASEVAPGPYDKPVPRPCHRGGRNKGVELSLSQVQAVQHLSLRVAAEQCGFKLQCRKLGIARWPHRKLKSLHNLIASCKAKAEALPAHEGAGESLRGWTKQLQAVQDLCIQAPTCVPRLPSYVETIRQWNVRHKYLASRKMGAVRSAPLPGPPPAPRLTEGDA